MSKYKHDLHSSIPLGIPVVVESRINSIKEDIKEFHSEFKGKLTLEELSEFVLSQTGYFVFKTSFDKKFISHVDEDNRNIVLNTKNKNYIFNLLCEYYNVIKNRDILQNEVLDQKQISFENTNPYHYFAYKVLMDNKKEELIPSIIKDFFITKIHEEFIKKELKEYAYKADARNKVDYCDCGKKNLKIMYIDHTFYNEGASWGPACYDCAFKILKEEFELDEAMASVDW